MGPRESGTHLQELHHIQLGVGLLLLRRGLAEQLGGVHFVPLVVLSCDTHRDVRLTRHTYRARDPRIGRLGAGPPLLRSGPALGRPAAGAPLLAGRLRRQESHRSPRLLSSHRLHALPAQHLASLGKRAADHISQTKSYHSDKVRINLCSDTT